jgi:glycosyltransferase involved in cell wall biosynthesis
MTTISIALATFNGEKHLPAQLESLAQQTKLPSELVVADDRSEDATIAILRAFADKAPFPVRIQQNERRLGYRDNFMRAVALCQSDLIAFCDQDDVWEPHKLITMERLFEDGEVLLAYHNASIIDSEGKRICRLYRDTADVMLFSPLTRHPWLVVPGFVQVFRRDLTQFSSLHSESMDVDWVGEPLPHDRWFFLLASVLGRIAFLPEPLVRYRQHGSNMFGVYPDRQSHRHRLLRGEEFIRAAVMATKNRSDLLRRIQDLATERWRERAAAGFRYYDAFHGRLLQRLTVHASASFGTRTKTFYALLCQGAYGRRHGSARFSWSELLVDGCLAVPLGPKTGQLLWGRPPDRRGLPDRSKSVPGSPGVWQVDTSAERK